MQASSYLRFALLGLVLALTSCKHYSSAYEKRISSYHATTTAGGQITKALKHSSKHPLEKIGLYLDAAETAAKELKINPSDVPSRRDYNFAVTRIYEIINNSALEPWKAPLACPGAKRTWRLSMKPDPRPERNPANFSILAVDRYNFKGSLVVQRTPKDGFGAPMIVKSKMEDATKVDPFIQGKHVYYGVTGIIFFNGSDCLADYRDPLATETITYNGHTYPLAANFTAPLALALAEQKPREKELEGLFRPDEFASMTRLARLEPYDPKKIPVLCIHGLGDSQATWVPMIETLRNDPVIRQNYQFWFFSYPTGYPYPLSAAMLRKSLDRINARYPDHKRLVVIGHSMGGMISRTLLTDSGMKLWNVIYDKPPAEMPFSKETGQIMTDSLIFTHRPEIARVIFCSASHRGANMANSFIGRLGSKLIGDTLNRLPDDVEVVRLIKPNSAGGKLTKMPNSIDFLVPDNRFVTTLDKLPLAKGVPYHSIIGDRGKGGNRDHTPPVSTDGIVPYWSSHLDGAASEHIIPSGHWSNQHPLGIAEIRRILSLHLGKTESAH